MCLHKEKFKTVLFPVVMPFEWLKFGKKVKDFEIDQRIFI